MTDISFRFVQFNPRRVQRGAEGARLEVFQDDGVSLLWMSEKDIRRNIMWHGQDPELLKALEAYKNGVWVEHD